MATEWLLNGYRMALPLAIVLQNMMNLVNFWHAEQAAEDAWRIARRFVLHLEEEEALQFDKWPGLLESVLEVMVENFPYGEHPEDGVVLHRLLANTVDVPQALSTYCHLSELCTWYMHRMRQHTIHNHVLSFCSG